MTLSIHDYRIRELTVQAPERMIRLVVAYPDITGSRACRGLIQRRRGVRVRGDALGTILFDIELVDSFALYRRWAAQMQWTYSKGGGHAPWVASDSDAAVFLSSGEVRGYRISSSIGPDGAVWARRLIVRAATA